jgi:hypothetical protein
MLIPQFYSVFVSKLSLEIETSLSISTDVKWERNGFKIRFENRL